MIKPKPGQIWQCLLTSGLYLLVKPTTTLCKYVFWNLHEGRETDFYLFVDDPIGDETWKLFMDTPQINSGQSDAPVL